MAKNIGSGLWHNFRFAWNESVATLRAQRLSRGVMVAHLVLVQVVGVRIPAGQPFLLILVFAEKEFQICFV